MSEKRKLKYSWQRYPKEKVTVSTMKKRVAEKTGYSERQVVPILTAFLEVIIENIVSGKMVNLNGIGRLYPNIRPPRNVVHFNNDTDELGRTIGRPGQKVKIKKQGATWVMGFKSNKEIKDALKEIPKPTQEQIDNLYRD